MKNNENLQTCMKNISLDVQVAKELKTLSEDIQNDKYELERTLEEIDSNTCSIKIERNWLGIIKKDSIEDTCNALYSNLSGYIRDCGESIQKTNENLGRSLELIKLLAIVEKDLYEQIDDQLVRNNEFNEAFLDWCKQKGINDDEVRDLLETSLHRAYTLRDRINNLRNESRNSITELGNRVGKLETRVQVFDNIIEEKRREFENIYKNKYDDFIKLVDEKKGIIDNSHKQFCQVIDKEKQEFQRKFDNSILEIDNKIKLIIEECENKLEKEHSLLKKSFNKKMLYAVFGSVTLSSLISLLVTTILH